MGAELSDVITWRDKAVYDLEDLDASPEKVEQLEAERAQLLEAAKKAAQAVSKRRRAAAKELASEVTAELDSLAMGTSKLEIRVAEREQLDAHRSGRHRIPLHPVSRLPAAADGQKRVRRRIEPS